MPKIDMQSFQNLMAQRWAKERFVQKRELNKERYVFEKFIRKDIKILDLCCGPGTYLISLHNAGYNTIGLDFSRGMLSEIKKRDKTIRTIKADAKNIPQRDETLDLVIFLGNSLEQIQPKEGRERVLKEVYRVLRPNGVLVLSIFNRYGLERHLPINIFRFITQRLRISWGNLGDTTFRLYGEIGFNHLYSYFEIKKELRKAGFKNIELKTSIISWYLIFVCKK